MKHLPAASSLLLFAAALAISGCSPATGCGQPEIPPPPKECKEPKPRCVRAPCEFKCDDGDWVPI